jgi:hypothetical protein
VYRTRDIVTILGLEVRDPAVQEVIDGYRLVLDDKHDRRLHWENPTEGLALVQEGDSRVGTIFLYGGGKDGFAPFSGRLPFCLSFSSTRPDVHRTLGPPTLTGGPTRIPRVAEDGGWDRYDRTDANFHFSYHKAKDTILLVTIMTPL